MLLSQISGPESLEFDRYADLEGTGFVEVVGDDEIGRRIIIISACHMPPSNEVHPDRLLR